MTDRPLWEALLSDADRLLKEHRYSECVINVATALEAAIASCLCTMLVRSPSAEKHATPPEVQMLNKRYMATIGSMPLPALRNVMMNVIARNMTAETAARALDIIERTKRLATNAPSAEHVEKADPAVRTVLESLRDVTIIEVRNSVVHQTRETSAAEAQQHRNNVGKLIRDLVRIAGA